MWALRQTGGNLGRVKNEAFREGGSIFRGICYFGDSDLGGCDILKIQMALKLLP